LRSTRARLAASGELRVTSQHLCCLRSSLPFDRERSHTQALTWLALPTRFTRSSGPAVNLGPHRPEASSRLTALRQFALSPVFRQRLESPLRCSRPTGLRPGDLRDTSLALASLRSPPSLDGGWSHVAVLPSHRLAAWRHRDASLALTSLRSPLPFDRGWSHVAVLRSYSARRLAEPQDHKSLAAISPERTQVLPLGTL
jgi:hypothetical protein